MKKEPNQSPKLTARAAVAQLERWPKKTMKGCLYALFSFAAATIAIGAPFTPRAPDEAYGIESTAWRFTSSLSKDASGVIELCYAEEGNPERILGRVEVRPFNSSEERMPDLRILFTKADVEGKKRVILLVSYGIRSGTFVVDVPGLTTHSLVSGAPKMSSSGEFTLMGFGDGAVTVKPDGTMLGVRGRLFFRYAEKS